jgi:beta-carotene ketolase (CrtW type)
MAVGAGLMALESARALAVPIFWVLPLVLSSLQLFLFGTYLPHRGGDAGPSGRHAVRSLGYPHLLSLLACYHFGYHAEHHAHPAVPWFRLPALRPCVSDHHGPGGDHGNGSRPLRPGR